MKMQSSAYLEQARPYLRRLVRALNGLVPYASVLGEDSLGWMCRASASGMSAGEDPLSTARGFVVRVWNGGFAEYAFTGIPDMVPEEFAREILRLAPVTCTMDKCPSDTPRVLCECAEPELDPQEMGGPAILQEMNAIREETLAMDERLLDCAVSCVWQKSHKIFLSAHRDLEQNTIWTCASLVVMAARGEEVKDCYRSFSKYGGAELLREIRPAIPKAVKTVTELLTAEEMIPGEYECVCAPDVTGMIVHEAFGHGVEMDMFVKDRALAKQYIGKRVASPLVTMHDGAAAAEQVATWAFDDEGTDAADTVVIRNGILERGMCDAVSAGRLGCAPTGNGRRESFRRKAYTRMTNTYFEGGHDSVEDMIASIRYGFLLENASSGMEDPKNWGIQCMVNVAREIRDGKLTGRVFSPIVLTGYVPDLLCSISMMSPTVELEGGGHCGKGYKEWVKVSDGGPYIKAKIRLG